MLEWHCMVSVEVAVTTQSMTTESADFKRQWKHYASTLTKACLKAKLSDEWVPQMDVRTGTCYYFNLKTATTQF
ncbi:hypothetical protein SPRG_06935 [Saprolegnia parasitica CBS 223.65]|uniref:WW domain-containing protein n=1 Tax=Saprolegnia parasitica (strain CBS 223.65) TaxID=695850 RepID=A0A067CKN5_SAPPC|nr:hypothetical protein SPRG_06935 [Saprolegnia parasitica CBS 223.65]KDO27347.1 hypothetical protein SPRG_06935 [Saprolegnia parasitica CBS 223.65]|eukprot:XP_012201791.1 hypothetical protein SPRG_06935 [Saprolegnia parasitica CBS 223.65]